MQRKRPASHPYIPNLAPEARDEMLRAVGASSIDEFYADIPDHLRLKRPLDLPAPLTSEWELERHVEGLLARNTTASTGYVDDKTYTLGTYTTTATSDAYKRHVYGAETRVANQSGRREIPR